MAGRGSSGSWRGRGTRPVVRAVSPAAGRGRSGHLQATRRDGGDVVVTAVRAGSRVLRARRPHAAGPSLRPPGQVISLDVDAGMVTARVQGSRATPYRVEIAWPALGSAAWTSVASAFAARAGFAARLLAGEVPPDLEAVFESAGVPLFPRRWARSARPLLVSGLGEPVQAPRRGAVRVRRPARRRSWLLLAWRGRDREAVLGALPVQRRPAAGPPDDRLPAWWPFQAGEPSPAADGSAGSALAELDMAAPDPCGSVLLRLDRLTATVRGTPVTDLLGPAYEAFVPSVDDHAEPSAMATTISSVAKRGGTSSSGTARSATSSCPP